MLRFNVLLSALIAIATTQPSSRADDLERDVVIYGGTASGVIAAVAAARQGASVVLIEPGAHVGGMVSGGLGHTDVGPNERLIGGLSGEFFTRAGKHYNQPVAWFFEPHVAEETFNAMLHEARVDMRLRESLSTADKNGSRIRTLHTTGGNVYRAKVFIDATYEGDLLKAAGVSYVVGREGRSRFGESLAGRYELLPGSHQFKSAVSPWLDGKLLPQVTPQDKLVPVGEGDGRIQAYCYRLCLTNRPENRVPIARPEGYDPIRYELLRRYLRAMAKDGQSIRAPLGRGPIPNGKCDANSSGPVSTDLPGASQEYPDATPQRRAEIREQHRSWAHGLLYFLQNDPAVPEKIRADCAEWGLCKDEFQDTGGWPHQLYVREARRMVGQYVLTQHDLQERRRKDDVIGLANYNIDIREVQWVAVRNFHFPKADDEVFMEGYISQPVEPWDIPYRTMLPRAAECSNLLVPVCISASTVAYGSFRMEPTYMIAGHAAGLAAAMSAKSSASVHDLNLATLQQSLRANGQILHPDK